MSTYIYILCKTKECEERYDLNAKIYHAPDAYKIIDLLPEIKKLSEVSCRYGERLLDIDPGMWTSPDGGELSLQDFSCTCTGHELVVMDEYGREIGRDGEPIEKEV